MQLNNQGSKIKKDKINFLVLTMSKIWYFRRYQNGFKFVQKKNERTKNYYYDLITIQLQAQTVDKNAAPIKVNLITTHHTILEQESPTKKFKNKSVEMLIVDLPPLSKGIAHRHTYPTFGHVMSGEIASVFEGKKHVYKAGDSF